MGASDLLIELLGKDVDAERELLRGSPEGDLGKNLVGERAGHDERRVTSSASEVDKAALSEEDDVAAIGHGETVNLRLDVRDRGCVGLQPGNVDFNIEVTNA